MATITWPSSGRAFQGAKYDEGLEGNVVISPGRNGNVSAVVIPGNRWMASVVIAKDSVAYDTERGQLEALIATLRHGENRLAIWNLGRPRPNGTLQSGSPTLSGTAAVGATSLALTGCSGSLLRGDRIAAAGQRFIVTADQSPSGGDMTVSVWPPVRSSIGSSTALVYDKPTSLYIPSEPRFMFPYEGTERPAIALELMEVWT